MYTCIANKLKYCLTVQISKLDATKLSQDTTIKDLKTSITSLQSKLNKLESEHDDLGKKFSSRTVQSDSEVKRLQQVRITSVINQAFNIFVTTCKSI